MKLCSECKHSVLEDRGIKKQVRVCSALEGKPLCINAREWWWPKHDRPRECGPDAKLWERK